MTITQHGEIPKYILPFFADIGLISPLNQIHFFTLKNVLYRKIFFINKTDGNLPLGIVERCRGKKITYPLI
jgi:hypothetical protein